MTKDTGTGIAANPSWLKKALIASLAVNLLVVGGIAGSFIAHHRHGGWHRNHGGGQGLLGFLRELPAEKREALRPWLEGERERMKALRDTIKGSWAETNAAISAEPFDKDKLKAALGKQIEDEMKLRTAISEAVVESAGKLDPAERQRLREWREKRGQRMFEGGRSRWRD